MGKTLFKLLLVVVALLIGGRWLLQWELRNSVDAAISDAQSVVYADYDRLDVGFDGKVVVKRISLRSPNDEGFSAFIQQIEVDMQSLPELIQRRLGGGLPERMSVRITGVTASLGNLVETLEREVDCMDPARQPSDWMLGLNQDSNITLSYDYQPASRELSVDMNVELPGAYTMNGRVRLGNVSANFRRAGSLDMVRLSYNDIRGVAAWRNFCAEHHSLAPEDVVSRHINAMEERLNYQGLSLTEQARAAYQTYLTEPTRVSARWVLGLEFEDMPDPATLGEMVVDRLELELAGTPVSPIFNKVTPKQRPVPQLQVQRKPESAERGPVELSFDEAREHIGATVTVVTGSKEVRGELISVGESELVLEVVKDGTNRFSITYYRSRLDRILLEP
ncbi:hypothetical protein L1F30_16545 [Simiduia sp. 21SJ11W-1]|uniref:hypothetical protein n=1 Tax=Simiduia sp. 21SJ11W-1 TaxID=2909669 RepID=UPI0020A08104|nr:hypothetical protein [Simiduia sp. 21SJ11W-1]UTA47750.1 hypothetical protein L1F30_16545 [Simiduia sp. 21SJ11W-1]